MMLARALLFLLLAVVHIVLCDYYSTLGVSRDATKEQIKKAYRRLAIKYNPDKIVGVEDKIKEFQRIAEAYEVVGDESKRRIYEQYGVEGIQAYNNHLARTNSTFDFFRLSSNWWPKKQHKKDE